DLPHDPPLTSFPSRVHRRHKKLLVSSKPGGLRHPSHISAPAAGAAFAKTARHRCPGPCPLGVPSVAAVRAARIGVADRAPAILAARNAATRRARARHPAA